MTSKTEQFYIRRIAELEKQVAELIDKVAKLSKNSSNSSKPPSSDIVKPPRKKKGNGSRNIGGPPRHTKHERTPFSTDEIDDFQTHTLDTCPDCGGKVKEVENAAKVVQQVEVVKKPVHNYPRHPQRKRQTVERTHLDRTGDLRQPRPKCIRFYMPIYPSSFLRSTFSIIIGAIIHIHTP